MRIGFVVTSIVSVANMHSDDGLAGFNIFCEHKGLVVLRDVAASEDFWVSVHSVEYLIALGYEEEARLCADKYLRPHADLPQKRIGYWRTQFRLSSTSEGKEHWSSLIKKAYLDRESPDRIHAAETLAKLGFSFALFPESTLNSDLTAGGMLRIFVLWGLANPSPGCVRPPLNPLMESLSSPDQNERKLAAYAISHFGELSEKNWAFLAERAVSEDAHTDAFCYLMGAAYSTAPYQSEADHELMPRIRKYLLSLDGYEGKAGRIELCRALTSRLRFDDQSILTKLSADLSFKPTERGQLTDNLLADDDDVRASVTYALILFTRKWEDSNKKRVNN